MSRPTRGRAVVTGLGVVAPSGIGVDAHWKATVHGESRLAPISLFDPSPYATTLAGEVTDFVTADHVEDRLAVQTDRWTHMGFAATAEALGDADLDLSTVDPYRVATVLASSSGGNRFGQRELQRLWGGPTRTVGAFQSVAWFYAASVGQVSIRHGLKGPNCVLAAETAGGLDSLAHAARTVRRGALAVLAGGTESPLSPYALACQQRSGWLSTATDPARAYRPFDRHAAGYVPAEGGAVLLVEDLESALRRGAPHVYGEVAGWGSTHDGTHSRRGHGGSVAQYARAVRLALERARVRPDEVDLVLPDALAVPEHDRVESVALRNVFGDHAVPVTTQKPLVGRLYQGGAALDAATALLAMRHDHVPAVAGVDEPAPGCALDFVRTPRPGPVRTVLVCARGFDGFSSALVLRRYTGRPGRPEGEDP